MQTDRPGRSAPPNRPAQADVPVPAERDPRRWLAAAVLIVAGFMDLLDVTIVNVAIPSIQRDLAARYAQVEWIVAGYVLAFAALLIIGGRLGDYYGRKRTLLVGLAGFTIASLLCGLTTSAELLIATRLLQGGLAGIMVPQILAILHVTFTGHERRKVLGIWGAMLACASVAGLVLGGVLVQWDLFGLDWRPIFLVNVPIGVLALLAAWHLVRESRSESALRLDLPGAILAVAAVLLLVYPLTEGRRAGWPAWIFLLMAASIALLVGFVMHERMRARTAGTSLVALRLFRSRAFSVGLLVWLLFWIALGGYFFMWTFYMQPGLGWTPLRMGLTASSFAVGVLAGSSMSVQTFVPRFGRMTLMAGALVNGIGIVGYIWVVAHYGPDISPWHMLVPMAVAGYGFGLVVAPMVDFILAGVPRQDAGSASGVLNTIQQVGVALGVALVAVLFFTQLDRDSDRGVDEVVPDLRHELTTAGIPATQHDDIVSSFRACVRDRSAGIDPTAVPDSCEGDPSVQKNITDLLIQAGQRANAHNFARTCAVTMWYGVGILIVVLLGMLALPRHVRTDGIPAPPPRPG